MPCGYRSLAIALTALGTCISCGEDVDVIYVDPPVEVGAASGAVVISGAPGLTVGYQLGDDFETVAPDGMYRVIWGIQGGYWSMPHLRVTGIGDPQTSGGATMFMECRVTTDDGEILTDLNVKVRLYAGDGFLFAPNYPLPVIRQPPTTPDDVPELDGMGIRFECAVRDNAGNTASVTAPLTLSVAQ